MQWIIPLINVLHDKQYKLGGKLRIVRNELTKLSYSFGPSSVSFSLSYQSRRTGWPPW
jgi:hypothetical protein